MRSAVILSGNILADEMVRPWIESADRLICADGGARHLRRLNLLPDLLVGDMDSIKPEDQAWLFDHQVPVRQYPVAKDETDSELAILTALEELPEPFFQHELIVIGAFGSRPDHVLANQLLVARLAERGWRFFLTDGKNSLYTMIGGQQLVLDLPDYQSQKLAISAIPVSQEITGLTYDGLMYPLDHATLLLGSTRGVSNRIEKTPVTISLATGVLLIVITPEE